MTHVVTEACIRCKYTDCVDVCPVDAFTVNQYQTLQGRLSALRFSPTLRFVGVGGPMYTASSVQGSFEALRSVNAVTHLTHYTVAHAHLGLYGFVSFVFFGAIWFTMPRITAREWPFPGSRGAASAAR